MLYCVYVLYGSHNLVLLFKWHAPCSLDIRCFKERRWTDLDLDFVVHHEHLKVLKL